MPIEKKLPDRQPYYTQLDGLRFLAVSAVMCCHWIWIPHLAFVSSILGSSGVTLFFVLSGFLITQILLRSKITTSAHWISFKQFYIRRCIRIFPIYYLLIFITYAINFSPCRDSFWWFITYTSNICYSIKGIQAMGSFSHIWSLAVEEQFYLLFPFFILFTPKRYILNSLYAIILVALSARLLFYLSNPYGLDYYLLMPCCLDSFGLGGILAFYTIFNQEKLTRMLAQYWVFLLSFCLFLVCGVLYYYVTSNIPAIKIPAIVFYRFFFSLWCFWVIGTACTKGITGLSKLFLENKWVIYLGKISYGIYLYHMFIPLLSKYLHTQLSKYLNLHRILETIHLTYIARSNFFQTMGYFLLTVLISSISWYLIEKPISRLKRYFSYAETPRPQSASLL